MCGRVDAFFFWRAQNRKKVIRHKSPSPQGGKGEKAADQRKASPFSTPPLPDKKKSPWEKENRKISIFPIDARISEKENFFLFPHSEEFRDQQQKSTFSELNFLVGGEKKAVSASFPRPIRQSQSVDSAGNVKKDNIHSGTHIGFSHKKK